MFEDSLRTAESDEFVKRMSQLQKQVPVVDTTWITVESGSGKKWAEVEEEELKANVDRWVPPVKLQGSLPLHMQPHNPDITCTANIPMSGVMQGKRWSSTSRVYALFALPVRAAHGNCN